ncbi:MAG: hypothetical protein KC486_14265 [Myxococcales bacterium]|nr:hypothetical protein [Myxococcales bacterium]
MATEATRARIEVMALDRWEAASDATLAAITHVDLDADDAAPAAVERALALLEDRQPALRGLGLRAQLGAIAAGLTARPQLAARITHLELRAFDFGRTQRGTYDNLYAPTAAWLAVLRALPRLEALDLRRPDLSSDAAVDGLLTALGEAPALAELRLDLHGCPPTSLGLLALLGRLSPARLRRLALRDGIVGAGPASASDFVVFEELELFNIRLTRSDAARLTTALAGAPLRRLWLTDVEPAALVDLARAPALAGLHALTYTGLDDARAASLADAPFIPTLRALDLTNGTLTAAGLRDLLGDHGDYALRDLNLTRCPIADAGLDLLAASPLLAGLERLTLDGCGIKGAGVKRLCAAPAPLQLRELVLSNNKLGVTGARALAGWHRASALARVALRSPGIPPKGRALLEASPLAGALEL